MVEISPSVLSANFANLQNDLDQLKKTKVKYLHLDIMENSFQIFLSVFQLSSRFVKIMILFLIPTL